MLLSLSENTPASDLKSFVWAWQILCPVPKQTPICLLQASVIYGLSMPSSIYPATNFHVPANL